MPKPARRSMQTQRIIGKRFIGFRKARGMVLDV
jgi:hypothetical protein